MQFNCDLEEKGENTHAVGKQRSEFQITLNQGLPKVGVMLLVHGLIMESQRINQAIPNWL
jgi:hypothetical protein